MLDAPEAASAGAALAGACWGVLIDPCSGLFALNRPPLTQVRHFSCLQPAHSCLPVTSSAGRMAQRYLVLTLALAVALASCADGAKPITPVKTCLQGQNGCKTCRKNKCVACEDGMGLKNGRTQACVMCNAGADCLSCSGNKPTRCTKCMAGMYTASKGACKPCKDTNCADCRTKGGVCKACMAGMALKGNKCVKCDGAGQVVVRARCKRCPLACDACASPSRCNPDGCADGVTYSARSGKCLAPAPAPGPEPEPETSS
ncbi:hypothetical protein ABPG75_004950 [Micractinium tetrahymenae]